MSSHSRPIWGICTKWSITHRLVKPASSAARAMSPRVAAVVAGWPGKSNRETCRPNSSTRGSSRCRRALSRAPRSPGATSSTGPGACTPAKPSSASRSATPAASRSWALTTLPGTAARRARLRSRTTAAGVSKTTACTRMAWRAAMASQAARRPASRPVESITVVSRRRSRLATIRSSTSKASRLARWSRSPRPTAARRRSEETTWPSANQAAAQCDLPAPVAPTSTTSEGSTRRRGALSGPPGRGRSRARPRLHPRLDDHQEDRGDDQHPRQPADPALHQRAAPILLGELGRGAARSRRQLALGHRAEAAVGGDEDPADEAAQHDDDQKARADPELVEAVGAVGDLVDAGEQDDHERRGGEPAVDRQLQAVHVGQVLRPEPLGHGEERRLGEGGPEAHHDGGDVDEQRQVVAREGGGMEHRATLAWRWAIRSWPGRRADVTGGRGPRGWRPWPPGPPRPPPATAAPGDHTTAAAPSPPAGP